MSPRASIAPRLMVVVGHAATLLVTWPLWQARDDALSAAPLPGVDFAWPLLLSCSIVLRWPRTGTIAHWIVLALALAADQTREQPQVLSSALLLLAAWPQPAAHRVVTLHLAALWFFSGLGKLTSARYLTLGGAFLLDGSPGVESPHVGAATIAAAVALAGVELALGILVLLPRWRRRAAISGALLHLGIVLFLSLVRDWNVAVWPWNAMLAAVALLVPTRVDQLAHGTAARAALAAFVALPLGFHLGVVDAPFAFQVYTLNSCRALLLQADGRTVIPAAAADLGVPLPPVARVFRVWFARRAGPSDRLVLIDDRPLAGLLGPRERVLRSEDVR